MTLAKAYLRNNSYHHTFQRAVVPSLEWNLATQVQYACMELHVSVCEY